MTATPLVNQIAVQIVQYIRSKGYEPGTRLVERRLADDLRVSRSPIRGALQLLERDGVVGPAERGGFVVLKSGDELASPPIEGAASREETYLRVAEERLAGELPDRITENELARRYDLTRSELAELLRRMSKEGWIDRLPGYGWEFLPMLTSLKMYEDSYHFRLVIEPAAILETTFDLDRAAVEASRDAQQRLVDGDIWTVSNAELFDLNSHHHEVIIGCSHNAYFVDALQRIDKTRRLIEYRRSLQREKALIRCREHVQIANLLLDGDNARASSLMYRHLATVSVEKTAH
ncbi:MAG: GntR family transcriptional regulator [Rhodococcus sp. (in: high G+C Gram-positive bacteria)]